MLVSGRVTKNWKQIKLNIWNCLNILYRTKCQWIASNWYVWNELLVTFSNASFLFIFDINVKCLDLECRWFGLKLFSYILWTILAFVLFVQTPLRAGNACVAVSWVQPPWWFYLKLLEIQWEFPCARSQVVWSDAGAGMTLEFQYLYLATLRMTLWWHLTKHATGIDHVPATGENPTKIRTSLTTWWKRGLEMRHAVGGFRQTRSGSYIFSLS